MSKRIKYANSDAILRWCPHTHAEKCGLKYLCNWWQLNVIIIIVIVVVVVVVVVVIVQSSNEKKVCRRHYQSVSQ